MQTSSSLNLKCVTRKLELLENFAELVQGDGF